MPGRYHSSLTSSESTSPARLLRCAAGAVAAAALLFASPLAVFASTPIADQFQINTVTGSYQELPAVATDAAGNFIVVWESYASDGTDDYGTSVQGRRLNSNGVPAAPDFQVNTSTIYSQETPAVAMNSSGAFVVVWESNHNESDFDIMAQRYNAAGARVGSEILVNSEFTAGDQLFPAVAMADNGDFVVVWRNRRRRRRGPGHQHSGSSFQSKRRQLLRPVPGQRQHHG